jgi:hypothetical protein
MILAGERFTAVAIDLIKGENHDSWDTFHVLLFSSE